jgi:glycosyltransferase involved in cell wall biosynthesis
MNKGFTLIIPMYNKVNVVRKTLDSVLNNHGSYPFRCIIVDDDSTDGSSEIGEEYDVKYPDVFQYFKIKHHGSKTPSDARNFGIKLAETEYIGFLDADDELCSGFIDRGCTFLDEHPEYSMYGNGYIHNGVNGVWDHNYDVGGCLSFEVCALNNNFGMPFCSNIYKTELVKQNLFTNCYHEDFVFKFKYIYNNPNIWIDNTRCDSIIYNEMNSESYQWNIQRYNDTMFMEIFTELDKEIPDFRYGYRVDENGFGWFWYK